ncbi:PIN domain-containing protein [Candidatus Dependentiae bacterium]|nr:PIN domain-containing protein [Candidatus Dependentiae bacterium]
MSVKCFIDTNVLIYLYSIDEIAKRKTIETLINTDLQFVISTQVINEFINVMRKKKTITFESISHAIKEFADHFDIALVTFATIEHALFIAHKYHYSYFDSLMVASALENKCTILYTEDMHANQVIEANLKVTNPFKL